MPRERELKLEIESASLPAVLQWLRKNGATANPPRTLTTVYFDTARLALRTAGITLRIRKFDNGYVQTIKRSGTRTAGMFDRPEWEVPVHEFAPDLRAARKTGLKPFRQKVIAKKLGPIFEVRTRRTDFTFVNKTPIALSIDQGQVIARNRRVRFFDIEIESRDGALDRMFGIARALLRLPGVRIGTTAKSDR